MSSQSREPNTSLHTYLDHLARQNFYGTLSARFENGTVVHLRREESILPGHLTEKPENHNESSKPQ
jgi:hypothetical protein